MRLPKQTLLVLALIIVLTNASCAHGGDEGVVGPPATPENNWDEMNWDEGEWE